MSQQNADTARAAMEAYQHPEVVASLVNGEFDLELADSQIEWDASRLYELIPDLAEIYWGHERGAQRQWGRHTGICTELPPYGRTFPNRVCSAAVSVSPGEEWALPDRSVQAIDRLRDTPHRSAAEWDHQGDKPEKEVHRMESSEKPARVLVVAHKTAATQPLLDAVRQRARRSPAVFTLLVPNATHGLHKVVDPEDQGASEAQTVIDRAVPALTEAAGGPVDGIVGDPDPVAAVHDAINLHSFDEVIVSTLSARLSRWLKLDLPSKVSGMGLPVTTVTPADDAAA